MGRVSQPGRAGVYPCGIRGVGGYSDRFRQMVGVLEWIAAAAVLLQPLRPIGCAIAIAVMLGVLVTLFWQRQFMRLEYPLVLLALLWLVALAR